MSRKGAFVSTNWNQGVSELSKSKYRASKDRLHLLRLMVLLDRLTENHAGETTRSLMAYLRERNLETGVRQLQRELQFLRRHFLLKRHAGSEGVVRWCWTGAGTCCLEDVAENNRQVVNLPLDASLRDPDKTRFSDSSMSKLLRVLTLVELIPIEEDGGWVSIDELCKGLRARGVTASVRTVQRDIRFIKRHFLIVEREGKGRKRELQRLEFSEWQTSFCPRLPGSDDTESEEYRRIAEVLVHYPHAMGNA
jgi:Fe2+ or Zn2+ uptake regulation protein